MLKIITNAPIYVWPLFALLVWRGLKARKTYIATWKILSILPAAMMIWSVSAFATRYGFRLIFISAVGIALGCWLGTNLVKKQNIKFDKTRQLIEIEGNSWPLILSLSIFCLRYFLGVAYAILPELVKNGACMMLECVTTILSGMFLGRLIGYWQKSKTSPHCDLVK